MREFQVKHRRTLLGKAYGEFRLGVYVPSGLSIPRESEFLRNIEDSKITDIMNKLYLRNLNDTSERDIEDVQKSIKELLGLDLVVPKELKKTNIAINSLIQFYTLDAICNNKQTICLPHYMTLVYIKHYDEIKEIITNQVTLVCSFDRFISLVIENDWAGILTSVAIDNMTENPSLSLLVFYMRNSLLHYALIVHLIEKYEIDEE